MQGIIIATLVLAIVGILVGIMLVFVGKKFYVEVDEREAQIRECLPGNNCGACGFAGCDALAAEIAAGNAEVNACPVGGAPVADKIGEIMGVSAEAMEKKVAFVRCKGSCEFTKNQGTYVGLEDCRSAQMNGIRFTDCDYGCLGLGSCVKVCPENAITVKDGIAAVDPRKCVGCGLCAKTCPRNLIELVPESKLVRVRCSNRDKGPTVKKVCSAGCIGCMLCTRLCPTKAITVENNLAHIDYEACIQCGKCAEKCPAHVINLPLRSANPEAPASQAAPNG